MAQNNRQKVNAILADKEANRGRKQLTELLLNQKSQVGSFLKIGSLLAVKILLQSSNLFLFYLAGKMRRDFSKNLKKDRIIERSKTSIKSDVTQIDKFSETCEKISDSELQKSGSLKNSECHTVEDESKIPPLPTLGELFKTSQMKQTEVAEILKISSTAVSASVRNADLIYEYLLKKSQPHS